MPRSKKVENDTEEGEIYSVSMTHQLHCLVESVLSVLFFQRLRKEIGSVAGCHNQVFKRR
jgi:hypothetical protein